AGGIASRACQIRRGPNCFSTRDGRGGRAAALVPSEKKAQGGVRRSPEGKGRMVMSKLKISLTPAEAYEVLGDYAPDVLEEVRMRARAAACRVYESGVAFLIPRKFR